MLKPFPLSSCQYVITILGKKMNVTDKNGHFVRACMEKMMDHQHKKNSTRNKYSNYNQMRAYYVECSPKINKKSYLIDLSIEQSTKHGRFRKSAGYFCI